MEIYAVTLAVGLWATGSLWYVRLALTNQITPALTPWIIMSTTMILGVVSYWIADKPSMASQVAFITATSSIIINFFVVLYVTVERRREISFNKFQKCMLALSGTIVITWILLKFAIGGENASFITNILTQVLMTIGYVALAERLWFAKSQIESTFFWSTVFLGGIPFLILAIKDRDTLGIVFAIRSVTTSGITVALLLRIKAKMGSSTL